MARPLPEYYLFNWLKATFIHGKRLVLDFYGMGSIVTGSLKK